LERVGKSREADTITISLVTSIYGGHDNLKPLPVGHGFDDAVCITDNPDLQAEGWRTIVVPSSEPPRLAAKHPRMMPFDFVDTDVAVWLDAAFAVVGDGFAEFCLDSLADKDLIAWQHPENRNCLYQEATYCQDWPKYASQPIREQTAHYRAEGMTEGFGLWACGTLVWRNSESAKEVGQAWLYENKRWSIQDQVSLPYVLWKLEPSFGVFPAHEFLNPYLQWHQHNRLL
jgi:hypothetical protein